MLLKQAASAFIPEPSAMDLSGDEDEEDMVDVEEEEEVQEEVMVQDQMKEVPERVPVLENVAVSEGPTLKSGKTLQGVKIALPGFSPGEKPKVCALRSAPLLSS
jgi:hypothetical protein